MKRMPGGRRLSQPTLPGGMRIGGPRRTTPLITLTPWTTTGALSSLRKPMAPIGAWADAALAANRHARPIRSVARITRGSDIVHLAGFYQQNAPEYSCLRE